MIKAFISYSSRNRPQAKTIHRALEHGGFEVWRDERRIEKDWSADIAAGLKHSDLLCLLWTKEAADSNWVRHEWLTARALDKVIVPLLFPGASKLPEPIENIQGVKMGGSADLVKALKSRSALPSEYDFRSPPVNGYIPFAPDNGFLGRRPDLLALYLTMIGQLNKLGINQAGLVGMGGVGKTGLIVEFAHRFGFAFDGVYWIQGADSNQLASGLLTLARDRLGLKISHPFKPDAASRYLLELLRYAGKHPRMLLIVDNLIDPGILADAGILPGGKFPLLALPCNLLFTTRRRFKLAGVVEHLLDVLSPESALQLLTRGHVRQRNTSEAEEICHIVGYLPLALTLITAYLRSYPAVTYARYLTTLRSQGLKVIDASEVNANELATRHIAGVGATLQNQWTTLRDQAARLILKLAAHLPEGAIIPVNRLGLLAGLLDDEAELKLPVARALNLLQQLSLLGKVENLKVVRLHPLVADFVRSKLPARSRASFLQLAALRLLDAYRDPLRLQSEYASRGIDQVIEDLDQAILWAPAERDLVTLQRLLDRERSHLRSGANLFQQLHYRAALLGLTSFAASFLAAGLNSGETMLSVRAISETEDVARVRTFPHKAAVMAVAVSAEANRLITGTVDGKLTLWDLATRQVLRVSKDQKSMIRAVAISPDGLLALSGGWDKKLICWDLQTGEKLWQRRDHKDNIEFIEISSNGATVLSGSLEGKLILSELASGRRVANLKGSRNALLTGSLSPDGRRALSGETFGAICLWDIEQESLLYRFEVEKSPDDIPRDITAVCFSPCNKFAAIAAGYSGALERWHGPDRHSAFFLWDIDQRRVVRNFQGHAAPVQSIAFSGNGTRLVSGSSDKTVKSWNVATGQCLRTFAGHAGAIESVTFTTGSGLAVSGGWDSNVILWDLDAPDPAPSAVAHSKGVRSLDLSGDGTLAASASDDGTAILWNTVTGKPVRTLKPDVAERINSVELSRDRKRLASADHNGTIRLWDTSTGNCIATIASGQGRLHAIGFSPDASILLTGSMFGWVTAWDIESGRSVQWAKHEKASIDDDSDGITAILVSPDGTSLVTAGEDSKRLRLWETTTGEHFPAAGEFKGHSAGVLALDQDDGGSRVLSGSLDNTAILWDAQSQRPLLQLEGHSRMVNGVALASSQYAVTTSWDKTLILWNLESGRALMRLFADVPLSAVAAKGPLVIAGNTGGVVCFFQIESAT